MAKVERTQRLPHMRKENIYKVKSAEVDGVGELGVFTWRREGSRELRAPPRV